VVDGLFLELLDRFEVEGRNVSHKKNANEYAPKMFADDPKAKDRHVHKDAFLAAMNRLFATSTIRSEKYRPPSRGWSKLVRK
jgi:hypothetical protein